MTWFFYVFIAAMIGSIEKLFNRWSLAKANKEKTFIFFMAFNISALFTSALFFWPSMHDEIQINLVRENINMLVCAGAFWIGASLLAFMADRHIEANLSAVISQIKIIASVIVGICMGAALPTIYQIIGILLIMLSLTPRAKDIKQLHPLSFTTKIASILLLVSALSLDKWLLGKGISKFVLLFSGYGIPILFAIFIQFSKKGIKSLKTNDEDRNYLILGCISGLLSVCFYLSILESLTHSELAHTIVLITSMLVLSSIGSAVLLKEKFSLKRHAASILLLVLGNALYYL